MWYIGAFKTSRLAGLNQEEQQTASDRSNTLKAAFFFPCELSTIVLLLSRCHFCSKATQNSVLLTFMCFMFSVSQGTCL